MISFSRQNDTGLHARTLCLLEKWVRIAYMWEVHALRTRNVCLRTLAHALTHSYMPNGIVSRALYTVHYPQKLVVMLVWGFEEARRSFEAFRQAQ